MATATGHVYSHTHWDRAWYWTFEETRTRLSDLMDDLLALLRREPRYRCFVLDGQMAMVEDYLAVRPERRAEVGRLAAAGRLLLGPFFVLPDLFIPSGESLVRNLELGHRLASALGPVMPLGYLPDPFGHPAQLPQVLAGFGIPGVVIARGLGDEGERLGADFVWEAPDGSCVLATHQVGGGYCNFAWLGGRDGSLEERSARAVGMARARAAEMARDCPHGQLLLANGCDHLPPQPELPALLEAVNRRRVGVRLRHSTPIAYQAAVRRAIRRGQFRPGLHRGELRGARYAYLLSGVLSARVDLKLAHHAVELELLRWSEPWLALARALGRGRDDRALLDEAWRLLLLCQPHDDICGCSIDAVHEDDRNRLARAGQLARRISERALEALLPATGGAPAAETAVAVHPHPWRWQGVTLLPGWRAPGASAAGRELASQRVEGGLLVETRLPALGWLAHLPSTAPSPAPAAGAARARTSRAGMSLDNGLIRVELTARGELRLAHREGLRCRFELLDEGDAGDTYDFSPPVRQLELRGATRGRVRVLEAGPLRAVAELQAELRLPESLSADRRTRGRRLRALPLQLRAIVSSGSPVCELELLLHNTVDDHRLRAALTLPFALEELRAGAPFQLLRRSLQLPAGRGWQQPPSPTVPLQGFAAAEAGGRGLAVLAPGLRELEARRAGRGTEVLITLLRAVRWLSRDDLRTRPGHAGPGLPVEGARQLGPLAIRLGLLPYRGDWASAQVARFADEHAAGPRVLPLAAGEPPAEQSFLSLAGDAVSLTALRPGRHGQLQARLVNLDEQPRRFALAGPIGSPRKVRLDGTPLPGRVRRERVPLRAGELLTLELPLRQR
jgi:mannosylglycerate hydrolase